jgi:hypothetical protein
VDETFYRVHWQGSLEFSPANAWSAPWGSERAADGYVLCFSCDGTGSGYTEVPCRDCGGRGTDENWDTCDSCDGAGGTTVERCPDCEEGKKRCERGYSCETSPGALIGYFREHSVTPGDGDVVIIFEGGQAGAGLDGEPLAVPSRILETLTWAEFTGRHAEEAA